MAFTGTIIVGWVFLYTEQKKNCPILKFDDIFQPINIFRNLIILLFYRMHNIK